MTRIEDSDRRLGADPIRVVRPSRPSEPTIRARASNRAACEPARPGPGRAFFRVTCPGRRPGRGSRRPRAPPGRRRRAAPAAGAPPAEPAVRALHPGPSSGPFIRVAFRANRGDPDGRFVTRIGDPDGRLGLRMTRTRLGAEEGERPAARPGDSDEFSECDETRISGENPGSETRKTARTRNSDDGSGTKLG